MESHVVWLRSAKDVLFSILSVLKTPQEVFNMEPDSSAPNPELPKPEAILSPKSLNLALNPQRINALNPEGLTKP